MAAGLSCGITTWTRYSRQNLPFRTFHGLARRNSYRAQGSVQQDWRRRPGSLGSVQQVRCNWLDATAQQVWCNVVAATGSLEKVRCNLDRCNRLGARVSVQYIRCYRLAATDSARESRCNVIGATGPLQQIRCTWIGATVW